MSAVAKTAPSASARRRRLRRFRRRRLRRRRLHTLERALWRQSDRRPLASDVAATNFVAALQSFNLSERKRALNYKPIFSGKIRLISRMSAINDRSVGPLFVGRVVV